MQLNEITKEEVIGQFLLGNFKIGLLIKTEDDDVVFENLRYDGNTFYYFNQIDCELHPYTHIGNPLFFLNNFLNKPNGAVGSAFFKKILKIYDLNQLGVT
tara:strand:+ start:39914 stop:40213 length:300 start_codon:yes stop_codon:yes gene_type:complete